MVIVQIIECSTRLKIPLVRNFAITKNKYPGCTTLSYAMSIFVHSLLNWTPWHLTPWPLEHNCPNQSDRGGGGPMLIYFYCVQHVFKCLMFKHWFCWKYQYNKSMFYFINHLPCYSCEWLCRYGPQCTALHRAYNAVKTGLPLITLFTCNKEF